VFDPMQRASVLCFAVVTALALAASGQSASLQAPTKVSAGSSFTISTTGEGSATFYLIGPSHILKRKVELGKSIEISGDDVTSSGSYRAIACESSNCATTYFQVLPLAAAKLRFLVHPSRVAVSTPNAINATAFVYDLFGNTVITPAKVEFRISLSNGSSSSRSGQTHRGISWFEMASTPKQGPLQIVASVGEAAEPRVIQQVASDACGLRMTATPSGRYVKLETDPIRDCTGNPLPDGTIVSFSMTDSLGRSTVDTPIKKDRAAAQFELSGPARVSVACGVALGNELSLGAKP
jgi:hypothetical protein